jgi:hypothetical protein
VLVEETITHLEMTSPDQLRPAEPVAAVALERVEAGSPDIRPTMERIAAPHHWPSLSWSDAQWRQWLAHPLRRQWIVRDHAVDAAAVRRVWLHTSSLDHPNALPNYRSRGFRPFHTEVRKRDLPA